MFESFSDVLGAVGALLLFAFMVSFTVAYSLGLRKNKILLEKYYTLVNEWINGKFKIVDQRIYRLSGFKVKCKSKGSSLEKMDLTLYLVNRENLLHHIISRFKPHSDVFLCEANFKAKPRFSMEIFNPRKVALPERMDRVMVLGGLEIWSSSAEEAIRVVEAVKSEVEELGENILRVSLRREVPHLIYSFTPSETKLLVALSFAEKLGDQFKQVKPKPKF